MSFISKHYSSNWMCLQPLVGCQPAHALYTKHIHAENVSIWWRHHDENWWKQDVMFALFMLNDCKETPKYIFIFYYFPTMKWCR